MMLMVALLGVLSSREAQAFYNPSAGRWLSRDPIGERGGLNLNVFVSNDSVSKVDPDGRNPVVIGGAILALLTGCGKSDCVCEGKTVKRDSKATGVVTHTWRENSNGGGGRKHVWITWDGVSADSNSDEMLRAGGPGDRKVKVGAGFTMPSDSPGYSSEALKLSPCDYDFRKLKACIGREAGALNGQVFGLCWDLPPHLISKCKAESKGCTPP